MGASFPLISAWMRHSEFETTRQRLALIREALAQYYDRNGAYPCPSARIRSEENYGFADHCIFNNPSDVRAAEERGVYSIAALVEGGVPYRKLNIPKEDSFDGWHHLLTYAITSKLTDPDQFDGKGAIGLVDGHARSVIEPPGSSLWVLISSGFDGAGAYNGSGAPDICNSYHLDGKNCAHTGTYAIDDQSSADGPSHFDDLVAYRTWVDLPAKEQSVYCSVVDDATGNRLQLVDGAFIRQCGATGASGSCAWMMCHNGALIPGLIDMQQLNKDAGMQK